MTNNEIRISTLIFGVGVFKDEEDYQHVFVIRPSPVIFPTHFVRDDKTTEQKLSLEMKINLSDEALFNRVNAVDMSYPWRDKDAFVKLNISATISSYGILTAEHNVVSTPGALIFTDKRIGLVSWQLEALATTLGKKKS